MGQAISDADYGQAAPFPGAATASERKRVLVGDKSAAIRAILQQTLSRFGFEVLTSGDPAQLRAWAENPGADLAILDETMLDDGPTSLLPLLDEAGPQLPVIVTHAAAAVGARRDYPGLRARLAKPFDLKGLVALCSEAAGAPRSAPGDADALPLFGKSPSTQQLYRAFMRLAQTDYPVLIIGESGTGADLVARALHKAGRRSGRPLATVDIAGLTATQMVAFPDEGAASARRGTLYLEEIGDLSFDAQARLLRLMKSEAPEAPRVIASTRKDLSRLAAKGAFREDLYYRLNVAPLRLPPLRERLADLPDIVAAVLDLSGKEGLPVKRVDPPALDRLAQYDWPGNILELSNFLRRLALLYGGEAITAEMVRAELAHEPRRAATPRAKEIALPAEGILARAVDTYISGVLSDGHAPPPDLYDRLLREIETPLLRRVLRATHGNKLKAAEILGLNRNTLRKKLEKLGI